MYLLLALAAMLAFPSSLDAAHRTGPAVAEFRQPAYVWVLGGARSNVYHSCACERVKKHRHEAEKMLRSDAVALGLRAHSGCCP